MKKTASNRNTVYALGGPICLRMIAASLTIAAGCVLSAQSVTPLQGPPLGAVFEPGTGSLLPLQGVAGSAIVGSPLPIAPLSSAAISSEKDYALGVVRDSGKVVLIDFASALPSESVLEAPTYPDRMILSPASTAAMLWYASSRNAKIITGLPGYPQLKNLDLSSIDRDPDLFALSDDGSTLLSAASSASPGNIYRFRENALQVVPYSGQIAAITFLRKSSDALLTDLTAQHLTWVRGAASTHESSFSAASAGIAMATGEAIGMSRDNRRALLGNPQSRSLTVVDLEDKKASSAVDCGCTIGGLTPLNGPFLFRLNEASGGPLAIVDGNQGKPSLTVVPVQHRDAR